MSDLILICGQPLSLKSTLAVHLASRLQWGLVATGFFGAAAYGESEAEFLHSRAARYEACASVARCYVSGGWSAIVEGNFARPEWRSPILSLAAEFRVSLTVVRCTCSVRTELLRRQKARVKSPFAMDRQAEPYDAAESHENVLPELGQELARRHDTVLLDVDTGTWRISVGESAERSSLRELLEEWLAYASRSQLS